MNADDIVILETIRRVLHADVDRTFKAVLAQCMDLDDESSAGDGVVARRRHPEFEVGPRR